MELKKDDDRFWSSLLFRSLGFSGFSFSIFVLMSPVFIFSFLCGTDKHRPFLRLCELVRPWAELKGLCRTHC